MKLVYWFLLHTVRQLVQLNYANASMDEYRLIQDLKNGYDPAERPVADHNKPVDVNLTVILQQISEIVCFNLRLFVC